MRNRFLFCVLAVAVLAPSTSASAGWRQRCAAYCGMYGGGCDYSPCCDYQPCQPIYQTVQRVVMAPTVTSELRTIQVTECRSEMRERTYTAYRQVPEYRQVSYEYTVCVPRQAVKTVNYTVAKPVVTTAERQLQRAGPLHGRAADLGSGLQNGSADRDLSGLGTW